MCAGCQAVVTNYGALFETCGEYGEFVAYDSDHDRLAQNYAKVLNRVIDNYWNPENQQLLLEQSEFYNREWTWQKDLPSGTTCCKESETTKACTDWHPIT